MAIKIASSHPIAVQSVYGGIVFEDRSTWGPAGALPNPDLTYGQSHGKFLAGNLLVKANPLFSTPEKMDLGYLVNSDKRTYVSMDTNGGVVLGDGSPPPLRLREPSAHSVGNEADGSIRVQIKISQNTNISFDQVKEIFEQATLRLERAAFSKYLKGKSINVLMVSQEDLKSLGYYTPAEGNPEYDPPEFLRPESFSRGVYDPLMDAVLINAERLDELTESDCETLVHEFLHACTGETRELENGNTEIRTGVYRSVLSQDRRRYISEKGRYLNEGLTEYLRVRAGGSHAKSIYQTLVQNISILAEKLGEEVLYDAYFNKDTEKLRKALEELHGPGAYAQLCFLTDQLSPGAPGIISTQGRIEALSGFITHGFEYFIMYDWEYSPQDRSRAPRQLHPSEMPQTLRTNLKGVAIFTNLTEADLSSFFRNATMRDKHRDEVSFLSYARIKEVVDRYAEEYARGGQKACIFIRYDHHKKSKALVKIVAIERTNHPHILGTATWRALACKVDLK